jgi:mRNA interferase RelE/StbE
MQIEYTKQFRDQYYSLRNDALRGKLSEVMQKVKNANTIREIPNLKKLTGYTSAYRIRMGTYRIGLHIKGGTVIFADFDHRKDIYSRFP